MWLCACGAEYAGPRLVPDTDHNPSAIRHRHHGNLLILCESSQEYEPLYRCLPRSGRGAVGMSDLGMTKPDPNRCEVKVDGAWMAVSLTEAAGTHAMAEKRCPACHGRVAITGSYAALVKRTLTHRRVHEGCPLIPRHFCGTASPHPEAVE